MTTATMNAAVQGPAAYVVANFRDGKVALLRSSQEDKLFTPHKRWAWKMTQDEAYECTQRLHQVQADGHHWQDVAFFSVLRAK